MTESFFRLGLFSHEGDAKLCLVLGDDEIISLEAASASAGHTALGRAQRLDDLLADWDRNFDSLRRVTDFARREGVASLAPLRLANLKPLPPVTRPQRLLYAPQITPTTLRA
jgi:hypothetical protein